MILSSFNPYFRNNCMFTLYHSKFYYYSKFIEYFNNYLF